MMNEPPQVPIRHNKDAFVQCCHNEYRELLQKGDLKLGLREELLIALERGGVLWEDIPPGTSAVIKLPCKKDYGIDVVDVDVCKYASQVKCYGPKSTITFTHMSTFLHLAKLVGICSGEQLFLDTTPHARLCAFVKLDVEEGLLQLHRHDFDKLYAKHMASLPGANVAPPAVAGASSPKAPKAKERKRLDSLQRPLRPPQIEALALLQSKPSGSEIRVQLPTGVGKTAMAMRLFYDELARDPHGVHVFFSNTRDLATQTKEEAEVGWGLPVRLIGCETQDTGVPENAHAADGGYIIVCVYNSCAKLPKGVRFGYKVVDEAHRVENEGTRQKQILSVKCDKTVLLSGTFADQDSLDYVYLPQDAIDRGYILDYKFHFGMFADTIHEGSSLKKLSRVRAAVDLLNQHGKQWTPALVYFNTNRSSQAAAKLFQQFGFTSCSINGKTPVQERNDVKQQVEDGVTDVVCLCGLWNESVTIKRVRTIMFADPRHSNINQIQIASRANRLHPSKAFYRIVYPCCREDLDNQNVQDVIKGFLNINPNLAKAVETRDLSRIGIELVTPSNPNPDVAATTSPHAEADAEADADADEEANADTDAEADEEADESLFELIYEEVYDRVGKLLPHAAWFERLAGLEKWLEDNKDPEMGEYRRPSSTAKNAEEKRLGSWICNQLANAKDNQRKHIMKQDGPYKAWLAHVAKYKEIYMSADEVWFDTLNGLEKWLEDNKDPNTGEYKRPDRRADNAEEKRLGTWIDNQLANAKDNHRKEIMKQAGPYNTWQAHVAKYKEIYMNSEEAWFDTLKRLVKWLEDNKYSNTGEYKRPSSNAKNAEEKCFGTWIGTQLKNTTGNHRKCIMKQDKPYKAWQAHIAKYKDIYMSHKEAWFNRLKNLEYWLEKNKDSNTGKYRRPKDNANDPEEKRYSTWIGNQLTNAEDNQRKQIMKQDGPYNAWKTHVAKYKGAYMSFEEIWFDMLKRLVKWLEDHKDPNTNEYKRPKEKTKNAEEKRLCQWNCQQLTNAKDNQRKNIMKQDGPYNAWKAHVAKYKGIYMSFEEVWFDTLKRLVKWLEEHKDTKTGKYQRPNKEADNAEEKRLGTWIGNQLKNSKDNQRKCIMEQDRPYKAWQAHVAKYKGIYMSDKEAWFDTLKRLEKWLEDNGCTNTGKYKRPKNKAKNAEEKRLANWIGTQLKNAKGNPRKDIMKQEGPYNAWLAHVAKYKTIYSK